MKMDLATEVPFENLVATDIILEKGAFGEVRKLFGQKVKLPSRPWMFCAINLKTS